MPTVLKQPFFVDDLEISVRTSVPKPPKASLKRSATYKAAAKAAEAANGDANVLLLAATQSAKKFDMNRHFILKRIQKDPELAQRLKEFVELDMG